MDDIASRRIISLHLLGSDIPYGSSIGSKVSLYKVVDSQPGQPVDPILEVTRDAFITFINSKDNTFTGNVSASFSVSESDATRILQASSSGRLVVVLQND
jgi:hypothetical protein